jgi:hypothetical protein
MKTLIKLTLNRVGEAKTVVRGGSSCMRRGLCNYLPLSFRSYEGKTNFFPEIVGKDNTTSLNGYFRGAA